MRILFVLAGVVFASSLGLLLAMKRHTAGGGAGGAVVAGTSSQRSSDPLLPDENVKDLSIPTFTLRDQDGMPITRDVFKGKVTVVDFFFTHCKLICPVLTQHMSDLNRTLAGTPVKFLSISVDPVYDTPEVLHAYAADHGADPARWTFASGDRETIGRIVTEGMHFSVGEDPKPENVIGLAGGKTMNNIVHPSWLALIGPKGDVLGIYLAQVEEDLQALAQRARAASAKLK